SRVTFGGSSKGSRIKLCVGLRRAPRRTDLGSIRTARNRGDYTPFSSSVGSQRLMNNSAVKVYCTTVSWLGTRDFSRILDRQGSFHTSIWNYRDLLMAGCCLLQALSPLNSSLSHEYAPLFNLSCFRVSRTIFIFRPDAIRL